MCIEVGVAMVTALGFKYGLKNSTKILFKFCIWPFIPVPYLSTMELKKKCMKILKKKNTFWTCKKKSGSGNVDVESSKFRNFLTRQDRQLCMPGKCHAGKFQPSLCASKRLLQATLTAVIRHFDFPINHHSLC